MLLRFAASILTLFLAFERPGGTWLAFGNGHFGITGGPVMGKAISELIAGNKPGIDLHPFGPGRF